MSDRWFIYKDGQALGPFTPEEIRQSLREGTFDPFDLVSREGSAVRRELVDVDELFFTSKVVYGEGEPQPSGANAAVSPPSAFAAVAAEATQASARGSPDAAGNGMLALASAHRATVQSRMPESVAADGGQSPRRRRKRDPKHFHVMDPRGRVLGPISAGEIQALFYKGVFDKNVKVMRDGSRAQVPVARFVAIYSESNRVKRAMQQGAHPMIQGGISPANQLPAPRAAMGISGVSVSPLAIVALVIALVVGSYAFYLFYTNGGLNWSAKDHPSEETQPRHVKKKRKVRPLPEAPQPKKKLSNAEQNRQQRLADSKRQRAKLLELKQRREARDKARKGKFAKTVAMKPEAKPKPKTPAKPAAIPAKPAAAPQTSPSQPLPKAPAPAAPPKAQGQTVASLEDGKPVTKLGPMSFDKSALKTCDGACNLTFTGAGGTVKVAFFKNVWGPTLEAKTGSVYLSGLVKKNGADTKIILSNVQ